MTYCGERTLVKGNAQRVEATTLKCRSWTCADCQPARKAQLVAQAHRGKADTFITLTVKRSSYADPAMAAQALAHAWRIIVKRAIREAARDTTKHPYPFGANEGDHWDLDGRASWPRQVKLPKDGLQYLAVVEAHESGWPHLHILARSAWIAQDWLAEQTKELLDAHRVDIRRISKRSQINAYVAKYCGKCTHKFGTTKRYWQSGKYQLSKYEAKKTKGVIWHDVSHSTSTVHQLVNNWASIGWWFEMESYWHAWTNRSPRPPPAAEGATAPPVEPSARRPAAAGVC
jgi:hypothetical protein